MKELFLVSAESTKDSLVLRTEDDEQYFLVVTDDLRTALVGDSLTPAADIADADQETADTASSSISYIAPLHLAASTSPDKEKDAESDTDDTEAAAHADAKKSATSSSPITAVYSASMNRAATARDTQLSKLDPRLSAPLKMTPREIQSRIRGGASVAEIAAANDVPESRIESYAHPVLLERSQKAEMAKRAHPVRDDGPARLTLWEILDTVFTARGLDVRNSSWDSYRDTTGQWVVTVSWTSGAAEHLAEWSYHQQGMTSATAVARNGLAASLIDPDFVPPVRSLSAITSPIPVVTDDLIDNPQKVQQISAQQQPVVSEETTGEAIHDSPQTAQTRRRRKAVTPHWEDVLLGVRSNAKRPRK